MVLESAAMSDAAGEGCWSFCAGAAVVALGGGAGFFGCSQAVSSVASRRRVRRVRFKGWVMGVQGGGLGGDFTSAMRQFMSRQCFPSFARAL